MSKTLLNLASIEKAKAIFEPYTHIAACGVLREEHKEVLKKDYPDINKYGYLPLETIKTSGTFADLIDQLQGPEIASTLGKKLNIDLSDKPRMITIRKWSAAKDGRIHNDGAAKIVTALLYLNDDWPEDEDGGRFRVLKSSASFDDTATEISPSFGNFVAFVRSENSWHGHRPFAGERRVIQITWLKSFAELERKNKRGRLSLFLKKFLPGRY